MQLQVQHFSRTLLFEELLAKASYFSFEAIIIILRKWTKTHPKDPVFLAAFLNHLHDIRKFVQRLIKTLFSLPYLTYHRFTKCAVFNKIQYSVRGKCMDAGCSSLPVRGSYRVRDSLIAATKYNAKHWQTQLTVHSSNGVVTAADRQTVATYRGQITQAESTESQRLAPFVTRGEGGGFSR